MIRIVDDMREEEVIATLFNFPEEIARHDIPTEMFYHITHQRALKAFKERGPSLATVLEIYPDAEQENIINGALSSAGLPASLEILRRYWQARRIARAFQGVLDLSDPEEIMEQAIAVSTDVAEIVTHDTASMTTEANAIQRAREFSANQHQIQCGIHPALYLRRKQLVYIGARPGCGKTAIMGQIASEIMATTPGRVVIFSLEMDAGELLHRLACAHAQRWMHPQSHVEEMVSALDAWLPGRQFTIDDRAALTINEIEATSAALVSSGEVSMIAIDYASLITGGDGERRNEQIASISRRLKAMAKRLNLPVVVLAQLKREEKGKPDDASFAETDQITRDADQLWLLSCEDEDKIKPQRPIQFRKVKCRGGSCVEIELWFDAERMTFTERQIGDCS